jgi:hypothetical protein
MITTYSYENAEARKLIDALAKVYKDDITIDIDHNMMDKKDMVSDFMASDGFNFGRFGISQAKYDPSIGKVRFDLSYHKCINNNGTIEPTESKK